MTGSDLQFIKLWLLSRDELGEGASGEVADDGSAQSTLVVVMSERQTEILEGTIVRAW